MNGRGKVQEVETRKEGAQRCVTDTLAPAFIYLFVYLEVYDVRPRHPAVMCGLADADAVLRRCWGGTVATFVQWADATFCQHRKSASKKNPARFM